MTDTALHRDLETLNLTTPNELIKAQLLGLYTASAPDDMVNILDEAPIPVRTHLADYLSGTIVTEVFTF